MCIRDRLTELFDLRAGIKMTHIPYRGTSLAVADLVAGQVQVVFSDPISALQLVSSGTLVALAVTSKERSSVAPEVPTVAESGYPGFDAIAWHGILAPTKALLEAQAMATVGDTPEHFAAFIKQDIAVWKEVASQANVAVK